jgi:nucleoid DNA-binding protein
MQPHKYFQKFAAAIVQRSGIARPTVEAVLPHVFDEIRYQLTEGSLCVPIEGFGTLYVKDVPEHEYLYNRNNANRICTVPEKKQIKFAPARNLTDEMNAGKFDAMRRSFVHMPGDPLLRKRNDLRYRPAKKYNREQGVCSRPLYKKKNTDSTDENL